MSISELGFYRELQYGDPDGETIYRTIELDPEQKTKVVAYLRDAPVLAASGVLATDFFTDDKLGPFYLHTDSRWVWYSDLAHYVEFHNSWLPDDFIAVATQTSPPKFDTAKLTEIAQAYRQW